MTDMPPPPFRFDVTSDSVCINDQRLTTAGPPSMFHAIFGVPDRIADAAQTEAPVGHRNNQFHYYDQLGITLNEHHHTHQIHAINLVLDPAMSHHPTTMPFLGILSIAGASLNAGCLESALAESSMKFTSRLPGLWFATSGEASDTPISVAVATCGSKLPSGRRSKSKVISCVSFGLKHDPWDTAYRP